MTVTGGGGLYIKKLESLSESAFFLYIECPFYRESVAYQYLIHQFAHSQHLQLYFLKQQQLQQKLNLKAYINSLRTIRHYQNRFGQVRHDD